MMTELIKRNNIVADVEITPSKIELSTMVKERFVNVSCSSSSSSSIAYCSDDGDESLLPMLPSVLLSYVVSYCDVETFISLLDASSEVFSLPVQMALSSRTSISMNFLSQLTPFTTIGKTATSAGCTTTTASMTATTATTTTTTNNVHNHKKRKRSYGSETSKMTTRRYLRQQDQSITRILQLVGSSVTNTNVRRPRFWKHLEVSNLRYASGRGWLDNNKVLYLMSRLECLDFSGCPLLDPKLLIQVFLGFPDVSITVAGSDRATKTATETLLTSESQPIVLHNLRHLNLIGCHRVDRTVIMAIATNLTKLRTVLLGGCSQTIDDHSICTLLNRLHDLEDLDLSGLKRITEGGTGQTLCRLLSQTQTKLKTLKLESCEQLRLLPLLFEEVVEERHRRHNSNADIWLREMRRIWDNPTNNNHQQERRQLNPNIINAHKLHMIHFNNMGTPRRGLVQGALSYFARGGCLREVHLSGCEQIQDWEVQILSEYCGNTLTCLVMRACSIGDTSLRALAFYCKYLEVLDLSACFRIGNEGCLALCGRLCSSFSSRVPEQSEPCTRLRTLRLASLPLLTNRTLNAMSTLRSLQVLDIRNCTKATSTAVCYLVGKLPALVDIDARGISNDETYSLMISLRRQHCVATNPELRQQSINATTYQLRNPPGPLPKTLKFVNNRPFVFPSEKDK